MAVTMIDADDLTARERREWDAVDNYTAVLPDHGSGHYHVWVTCDMCGDEWLGTIPTDSREGTDALCDAVASDGWEVGKDALNRLGEANLPDPEDTDGEQLRVMREEYVFCPSCFVRAAETMGLRFLNGVELYSYAEVA